MAKKSLMAAMQEDDDLGQDYMTVTAFLQGIETDHAKFVVSAQRIASAIVKYLTQPEDSI